MRPRSWLTLALLTILAVLGYAFAGPYLAVRDINQAIAQQDADALARYVDFVQLRIHLKAQLQDRIARQTDNDLQSNWLGQVALSLASGVTDAGVETLVTPLGIVGLLQGYSVWKHTISPAPGDNTGNAPTPTHPLREAEQHFESTTRFTATVYTPQGAPVVFVLTRDGLRWRLTNILLPPQP